MHNHSNLRYESSRKRSIYQSINLFIINTRDSQSLSRLYPYLNPTKFNVCEQLTRHLVGFISLPRTLAAKRQIACARFLLRNTLLE